MVVIIGAGPAGCYLGYLLAKAGKKVDIFEEHRLVGYPVQCTGIVTSSVLKIIDIPRDVILNQINKIKIIADKEIIFKLKEPNLILNRAKFDQYLAKKAEIAGAKLYLNHSYKNNNKKYVVINDKKIKFDYLIGADGPLSGVLTNNNFEKNKLIYGIQASIKGEFEKNTSLIFLKYGEFAWLVPISKKMVLQKKNIFLLGDAAAQVKATTYGGIIYGLGAARLLSLAILKNKDYNRLSKKLHKDLYLSLLIRKILNRFTIKDYNLLIGYLQKNKTILEEFDRDYPSKFLFKLILKEPRLLR